MRVVMSSGHGSKIEGACGILNEVEEARRVVECTAGIMRLAGVHVITFHDDESTNKSENLDRICDFHNAQGEHELDVSVHFNDYDSDANGTECWYVTQAGLADDVSAAIAEAGGFANRGPKKSTELYFLNHTAAPAILIEVCFVNADAELYRANFDAICAAIADVLSVEEEEEEPAESPPLFPVRPLRGDEIDAISAIAQRSAIAAYNWQDRGVAPIGYIEGMALTFANVYRKLHRAHLPSLDMAQSTPAADNDALVEYADVFKELGMVNDTDVARLRYLFALLIGHGMRESSGRHCEGRDMSADNVSADTAEAGLFQTSWNAHTCTYTFDQVFREYSEGRAQDFLDVFGQGVTCSDSEWDCYGSGDGYEFQLLCKQAPAFAAETAALTLRHRCNHYGPIMRKEVELRPEANDMLRDVERFLNRTAVA